MGKFYLLTSIIFCSFTCFATKDSLVLYSIAIQKNIKSFISYSNKAYNKKDYVKAKFLHDSLINNTLIGTQFDDFKFKCIGKKKLQLSTIKIPTIIFTYASWCVMEKGEIPAINKMALDFKGKIKIVVLFWNKKKDIKKTARKFNSQVEVCYAHESYAADCFSIKLLKKTLGFPTSYYLDANRMVVDIKKRVVKPDYKTIFDVSYTNCLAILNHEINSLLISNSFNMSKLATY